MLTATQCDIDLSGERLEILTDFWLEVLQMKEKFGPEAVMDIFYDAMRFEDDIKEG